MAIGYQDHRGVTVPVSVALGGLGELGHFGIRQILAASQLGVGLSTWCDDCSVSVLGVIGFRSGLSMEIKPLA